MKKGLFPSVAFLVLFILLSGYVKSQPKRIRIDLIPHQRFFKLQSGVNTNLNAISYFNPARGIVVGDNGTILLTKNGGHNWQSVGGVTSVNLYGAAMVDSLIAIAVGEKGTILRSTDGGMTWGYVNSENVKFPKTLRAVAFYSKKEGYAVGDKGLFVTKDAGASWKRSRIVGNSSENINAIAYNIDNLPQVVGDNGPFFIRNDSLKKGGIRSRSNLRSIHFIPGNGPFKHSKTGFAVGDKGVILITFDGGSNWLDTVKSPVKMNLNGVFLHSPKLGYAVGDSGTVLRYNGKTWEMLTPSTTKKLNAVDPVYLNPTSTCVGEGGLIMLVNPPPVEDGTTTTLGDLGGYTLAVTVNTQNLQGIDIYGNPITYINLETCSTIEQTDQPGSGWAVRDQFINISDSLGQNQTYSRQQTAPNQLDPIQLLNPSGEIGYFSCYLNDSQGNFYLLSTYEIVCD